MRRASTPKGNPAGVQARKELVATKVVAIKRARRRTMIVLLSIFVVCLVAIFATVNSKVQSVQAIAGGGLVVGFFDGLFLLLVCLWSLFGVADPWLTIDEYRALPGAMDDDGEHRCISCGHRGIYRRTIYRTRTALAACSKCEAPLWAGTNS